MQATEYFYDINKCFYLCQEWVEASIKIDNCIIPIMCGDEKPYPNRVTKLFNKIDAVDINDIINELSQCHKNLVREISIPLFGFTSYFDNDISITNHRPSVEAYKRIKTLKQAIVIKIINVCGFHDLDDLFPIPQHLRVHPDYNRFSIQKTITNNLFIWAQSKVLLTDGENIEDFTKMIKAADFSEMWNMKKSHAKVMSLIYVLHKRKVFWDNEKWLATVLRSIKADSKDLKNRKQNFVEEINKSMEFCSKL